MENINEEKCNAWCDMLMALMRMTKDLNDSEATYIKANFSIAFGKLQLQELENQTFRKNMKKEKQ